MDEIRSLEAQEALNTLFEISNILNTGLSKQALSTCVSLCENGANPEALAAVIKDLQGEVKQSNVSCAHDIAHTWEALLLKPSSTI